MTKEELEKKATEYALEWGDKTDGTYACCRDGYLAGAEPREKQIAELTEQNTSLLTSVENLNKSVQELEKQLKAEHTRGEIDFVNMHCNSTCKKVKELEDKIKHLTKHLEPQSMSALFEQVEEEVKQKQRVEELEAQIEKMKYCGNCENGELYAYEEPCLHCQRCFASTDVTDQENVKDNWEAIKEIKEK